MGKEADKVDNYLWVVLGLLLLCMLLGGGYAIYSLSAKIQKQDYAIENGCWRVNEKMDLTDLHQRALIARIGLFALRESEVLYFVASKDSDGQPLDAKYDYVLEGLELDTRYWSYTLYGDDFFLVKNEADKFGFNLDNVQYDAPPEHLEYPATSKKSYQINISSKTKNTNWLPSGEAGNFHITLRMYNPAPSVYENLAKIELPTIRRIEQ